MTDEHKSQSKPKACEWSDKSKYNSFSAYKGLTWYLSHYVPIAKWFKGEGELPAPIQLSLDPSHLCNFICGHCNAQRYLVANPDEVPKDKKLMTKEHLERIIDFISDWRVRGVCLGGGGEPLTNKNVWGIMPYISRKGIKIGFATNGSLIDEEMARDIMHCRYAGISVDSGTRETFERIHGVDYFDKVISNLRLLIKTKEETGSKVDVAYKFLITPDNWQDLESACRLAKDIGVKDFHARPADLERKDFQRETPINYDMERIQEIFMRCHELEEGDDFRVFTIMHKFSPDFRVMHPFKNCVSSSLMLQACSDGNYYVCADHRIEPRFKMASHYPEPREILKFWGSDEHRRLLQSINVDKECGRCTGGEYTRQIEELAMGSKGDDPMCLDLP